jgi:type III restriction enzyme
MNEGDLHYFGHRQRLRERFLKSGLDGRAIEFDKADFKLSNTKPFSWRRNLPPPLELDRTVFNYVATYNQFERDFAKFLDKAKDIRRFAALGTTEQRESATLFRVDYLKVSGAIGFYHPDWVAVQKTAAGEVNWILETKGRVWEGTLDKDAANERLVRQGFRADEYRMGLPPRGSSRLRKRKDVFGLPKSHRHDKR